jgi:hypothetical protein
LSEEQDLSVEAIDAAIRRLRNTPPEQAANDLAAIANRAIIELHNVARSAANERRGAPDWGQWARLANAARSGVLQVAAVRDTLKSINSKKDEEKDE